MLYTTAVTPTVFGLRREIERLFESTFGRNQVGRSEWILGLTFAKPTRS